LPTKFAAQLSVTSIQCWLRRYLRIAKIEAFMLQNRANVESARGGKNHGGKRQGQAEASTAQCCKHQRIANVFVKISECVPRKSANAFVKISERVPKK